LNVLHDVAIGLRSQPIIVILGATMPTRGEAEVEPTLVAIRINRYAAMGIEVGRKTLFAPKASVRGFCAQRLAFQLDADVAWLQVVSVDGDGVLDEIRRLISHSNTFHVSRTGDLLGAQSTLSASSVPNAHGVDEWLVSDSIEGAVGLGEIAPNVFAGDVARQGFEQMVWLTAAECADEAIKTAGFVEMTAAPGELDSSEFYGAPEVELMFTPEYDDGLGNFIANRAGSITFELSLSQVLQACEGVLPEDDTCGTDTCGELDPEVCARILAHGPFRIEIVNRDEIETWLADHRASSPESPSGGMTP